MAGKFGPASVFLLVDGYNLTAAKIQSLSHKTVSILEKSDGLGDVWEEHMPTGQVRQELVQDGAFFDTATGGSHAALSASVPATPQDAVRIVCFGFAGQTIGEPFVGLQGVYQQEYEVLASRGALQKANAAYTVTGRRDPGSILQPLEVKTADWNTEAAGQVDYTLDTGQQVVPITSSSVANPSVITTTVPHGLTNGQLVLIAGHAGSTPSINGVHVATVISTTTFSIPVNVTVGGTGGTLVRANSLNGGAGYQQITAFSGFSGFVGKVRHSTDDVTYADLATFANVTSAPAKERVVVAPGTTVHRYLAFDGNVTGAGSITAFGGFSRS